MGIDIFSLFNNPDHHLIPGRDPGSVSGSQFIQNNIDVSHVIREQNILNEILGGNIPDFLRKFISINISDNNNSLTYLVMSDVLSIGSDEDYIRIPMNPHTAQTIANKFDCTLPTTKMVRDIWKHATKISPIPHGPPYDATMESSDRYVWHNNVINTQLKQNNISKKVLLSGAKKDVVIDNKLSPNNPNKRVAIYGWIQLDGTPIQGLNPSSHDDLYADYSHGIRMIANDAILNGNLVRMQNVFQDTKLSYLVSDEEPLTFLTY